MSEETQNKFTPEEEEMLNTLSGILRKDRERKYIEKTVADKIAATHFTPVAHTGLLGTATGKIIAFGAVAVVAVILVVFLNNNSGKEQAKINDIAIYKLDTTFDNLHKSEQATQVETKENQPAHKQTRKMTHKEKGAVPGLPLASTEKYSTTAKKIQEYSFTKVYKFSKEANLTKFRSDLKRELDKLGVKFTDRSGGTDIINLISEKSIGVNDESRPVEFYIVAKVNKRFPGNLNMSLRYYFVDNTAAPGTARSINRIFYNNVEARVSGLINWRYKP